MELEELKQKWNKLDERLSKSEVYNRRMLEEMLKGKNQTHYEQMRKQATGYNFIASLLVPIVVVPILHEKGIFHDASFYLLETVCVIGLLMVGYRLILLSRFNVMSGLQSQLRNLVNYKRTCVYETVIGIPLTILAICLTLYFENAKSPVGLFFVALGVAAGALCGWMGWKKHQQAMQAIESNLKELKEFEASF